MDWNRDSISAIMSCAGSNMEAEPEWSWAEEKTFENALVTFSEHSPDRWENIARLLPEKSLDDILIHYEILVADVAAIEAGNVEVPDYPESPEAGPSRSNRSLCERKKGESWSVEEHRCFLQGVEMFGKSDWRNICRHFVKGRSPAQVSSHAQKFVNRQTAKKKKKKDGMRASIHDLTTVAECDAILQGRLKLNDAANFVNDAYARSSSSLNIISDFYPFSQGRSSDFSPAAATVMAVPDVYARPSPSFINFDDSPFFQGRSNDFAATAATIADAYARPSPSFINFDDSNFSQGRFNDFSTAATVAADASATPSPSSISASPFSQGRSNDAAIATANVVNDADVYPFFSQGRSNAFSTAAATAMAVPDVYARPSPNFVPFDDSPFFQGISNDFSTAATTAMAVPDVYARPSPNFVPFDDSPFFQGISNDFSTAATTAMAVPDVYARPSPNFVPFDDSPFFQGISNDFSTAATTAMAVPDVYARPSPNFVPFDDSPFFQGRWNDDATSIADAYARPSPSMNAFDDSAFSRGRSNDAAYNATAVADAYARASVPSLIIFDDADSSQGRGQGSSPFDFK
ncbi:hypothetical protein SASPL_134828 [Salvia splendens]|uniref:Uncharacterized protein n=1 Tax=Salvia splendens TaxID=180675 RepID=A0A8X8ZF48_SALSN|nr:hypothetical protein SASPL_134828 [Salvia splendens]